MNYYNEIKQELINNEITKKIKDYSKNKSDLTTYYNVGKILAEAGKHYGEGIIENYSIKLSKEVDKKYNKTSLKRMRQFFLIIEKGAPLAHQLHWSHYVELLPLKDINKINYYIKICINSNLTKRELRQKIKSQEYERLPENAKQNLLIDERKLEVSDLVKNPIIIKNNLLENEISEKVLKKLILEQLDDFLQELGNYFCYRANEYKIKIGDRYNYIDLLLYSIKYKYYVVIELKITELKKEHIGQIEVYMNYIDDNLKSLEEDKTIGIIICKKDNQFIMQYCSDSRILSREYKIE